MSEMDQEAQQPRVRHRRSERRAAEEAAAQREAAARMEQQDRPMPQGPESRVQRPVSEPVQNANYPVPPAPADGAYGYEPYRPESGSGEAPQGAQGFGYAPGWYVPNQGGQGYQTPPYPVQERGFTYASGQNGGGYYGMPQGSTGENTRQNTTGDPWGWSAGYRPVAVPQTPGRQNAAPNPNGPEQGRPRRSMGPLVKVLLILLAAAVLGFAGYSGWRGIQAMQRQRTMQSAVAAYSDRFCPNVFVDGINLSGMTMDEATQAVNDHQQASTGAWFVRLTWEGETIREIRSDDLGITVDVNGALQTAWQQGHQGDLEQRYAAMQALRDTPYEGSSLKPDTDKLDGVLALVAQQIYLPSEDAAMIGFNPDATDPFTFKPEVVGRVLDPAGVENEILRRYENMESGELVLAPEPLLPSVTVESLRNSEYTLRGYATTPISPTRSTEDRNKNIRRAFELVSGTVIQPGGQFSFNGVVGQRTIENGFFPAEEYVSGLHEEGIGGGVCQASTTIFQAAVRANLQIDKRTPHSMAVNYTDYGKDATVYWWVGKGGQKIDFAFTNNTEHPIYIKAAVQSAERNRRNLECKVWIYGESLGSGVSYEIVTEEVVLPAPEEPEVRRDKDTKFVTYKDETYEYQKAENGTEVHRWLVRYVNKKEVERQELETDVYPAKQQIVYVGIRERPEA